ncbi:MAG TPA: bacillithiol biosynthesis cysteine-adding enzyme BshC [Pyrinomonadaceae bacterium]|jgi:bacillithiol biosynthesis cysteine-adding enzyme BshC|nr:bacillithiol biosynthesis cysteine-adding enzyme BshC [Pyrinomonadaceae bacterium]
MITSQAKENTALSFEDIPHQSKLFLDYLKDPQELKKFYPGAVGDIDQIAERKSEVLENYKVDRDALCDALREINEACGCTAQTLENIERLREKDTVAIVTGQQAGLFSGPLYTIFKAISAIKLAEKLNREGTKAVPVFWIAEEDHDFAEVNHTYVIERPEKGAKQTKIENTPADYKEGVPVADVKLDESIRKTLDELFHTLPQSEFTGELKEILEASYRPDVSYSTAFGKLLARLSGKYGLIIFQPMHPVLKKLAAPITASAVEKWEEINSALLARTKELESAGYSAQVLVEEKSFPFFYFSDQGSQISREKIKTQNSKFKIQNSERELSELKESALSEPQRFSPNALLRPVIQDYLLPVLCYFGGGAEISYFAQNSEIYRVLERPYTPIFHRFTATVVEPHVKRTLEKYGLTLADFFAGADALFGRITEKFLNRETAADFAEAEEIVNTQMNRLEQSLLRIDPTLAESVARRRKKMMYHIAALRKKFHRAQVEKDETVERRLEAAKNALYPQKALQERSTNFISLAARHGVNVIDHIYERAEIEGKKHQIISI